MSKHESQCPHFSSGKWRSSSLQNAGMRAESEPVCKMASMWQVLKNVRRTQGHRGLQLWGAVPSQPRSASHRAPGSLFFLNIWLWDSFHFPPLCLSSSEMSRSKCRCIGQWQTKYTRMDNLEMNWLLGEIYFCLRKRQGTLKIHLLTPRPD